MPSPPRGGVRGGSWRGGRVGRCAAVCARSGRRRPPVAPPDQRSPPSHPPSPTPAATRPPAPPRRGGGRPRDREEAGRRPALLPPAAARARRWRPRTDKAAELRETPIEIATILPFPSIRSIVFAPLAAITAIADARVFGGAGGRIRSPRRRCAPGRPGDPSRSPPDGNANVDADFDPASRGRRVEARRSSPRRVDAWARRPRGAEKAGKGKKCAKERARARAGPAREGGGEKGGACAPHAARGKGGAARRLGLPSGSHIARRAEPERRPAGGPEAPRGRAHAQAGFL